MTATMEAAIEARISKPSARVRKGTMRMPPPSPTSDPTPPAWSQFWFGSHPTVLQRAGMPASLEQVGE